MFLETHKDGGVPPSLSFCQPGRRMSAVSWVTMRTNKAVRLLGTLLFLFGSLQCFPQSAPTRQQQIYSHKRQAAEYLKENRPDLAAPEFKAIVASATSACCCSFRAPTPMPFPSCVPH